MKNSHRENILRVENFFFFFFSLWLWFRFQVRNGKTLLHFSGVGSSCRAPNIGNTGNFPEIQENPKLEGYLWFLVNLFFSVFASLTKIKKGEFTLMFKILFFQIYFQFAELLLSNSLRLQTQFWGFFFCMCLFRENFVTVTLPVILRNQWEI